MLFPILVYWGLFKLLILLGQLSFVRSPLFNKIIIIFVNNQSCGRIIGMRKNIFKQKVSVRKRGTTKSLMNGLRRQAQVIFAIQAAKHNVNKSQWGFDNMRHRLKEMHFRTTVFLLRKYSQAGNAYFAHLALSRPPSPKFGPYRCIHCEPRLFSGRNCDCGHSMKVCFFNNFSRGFHNITCIYEQNDI